MLHIMWVYQNRNQKQTYGSKWNLFMNKNQQNNVNFIKMPNEVVTPLFRLDGSIEINWDPCKNNNSK